MMQLDGFTEVGAVLRSGVYVLVAKGVVIYVGKSRAMIARIGAHRRAWIDKRKGQKPWLSETLGIPGLMFDEVHIRPVPLHLLDEVEREMIDRFKPRYNVQLKTTAKIAVPIAIRRGGVAFTINAPARPAIVIERRI